MKSLLKLKFSAVEHYSGAFTIFLKYFHLPFVFQMWIKIPSQFHPTCVHLGLWWNRKWLSDPCRSSFYPGVHNQWGSTWILCRSFSQKKPHCFLSFTVEHHDITDRFCHQILALSCAKIYSWHWVSRITEKVDCISSSLPTGSWSPTGYWTLPKCLSIIFLSAMWIRPFSWVLYFFSTHMSNPF